MSLLIQGQIRDNSESSFVNSFLRNIVSVFPKEDYIIIQEAYAESGIPDIILLAWKESRIPKWNNERTKIKKQDLNILHYLYSRGKKPYTLDSMENLLGYSKNTLKVSLERLSNADLLCFYQDKISLKKLNEVFFLDEIISIEAKLNNKKKATHQALMNQNFSSKSYILMPENKYKRSSNFYEDDSIGCITFDGEKSTIDKKPTKNKIPGSPYSWVLNEYLVRAISNDRI